MDRKWTALAKSCWAFTGVLPLSLRDLKDLKDPGSLRSAWLPRPAWLGGHPRIPRKKKGRTYRSTLALLDEVKDPLRRIGFVDNNCKTLSSFKL